MGQAVTNCVQQPKYDFCYGALQTETLYYGDRKISIRTSVLEEKATACNMLCCYADELEVGFFPYVEQVSPMPARSSQVSNC